MNSLDDLLNMIATEAAEAEMALREEMRTRMPECPNCAELHEKLEAAREFIRNVPHDPDCDVLGVGPELQQSTKPCNCGKEAALQKLGVEG